MNLKSFANAAALFLGLGLIAFQFNKGSQQSQSTIKPPAAEEEKQQKFERWQVKSIYDGDTLRARRGEEELKIRFCGIDAPELKMPLGIESRDYLRSLVELGNGELLLVPVEKDRYGRTVAEVYVKDSRSTAINLNVQMVRDGYAWHYEKYSGNCPVRGEFARREADLFEIAQELAQKEGLGIWKGNPQPPWEFRRKAKK